MNLPKRVALLLLLGSLAFSSAHRRRLPAEELNDYTEGEDSDMGGRVSYKIQSAVSVKGTEEDTLANYDIPEQDDED